MKEFDYYSENPHDYPSRNEYERQLKTEIDATPMTAAERKAALAAIGERSREWFKEQSKPYYEHHNQRQAEFWADCKEDLGYGHLNEKAIGKLEAKAWERGHSGGYADVYWQLQDLWEFVEEMLAAMPQPGEGK